MNPDSTQSLLEQLEALRTELVDRAFVLDRGGHPVAADVAMITAARLAELRITFIRPQPARPGAPALSSLCSR